jgi:erythronate-4-phosphate dehydrogenase
MRLVIDSHIPYLEKVFDAVAKVDYLPSEAITPATTVHADALIIRTRTLCNAALLAGSAVKLIASATIGLDHIDLNYCRQQGIATVNAPGSNARSVQQYMASALSFWSKKRGIPLEGKTIGIVGVGCVGRLVQELANTLGMTALCNDPLRCRNEYLPDFVSLAEIAERADIITFHTPLTSDGAFPTFHLANEDFFNHLKRMPLIINAARGDVVDEQALLRAWQQRKVADFVLDCWHNEPLINDALLRASLLGTPHIAGYSADGKACATRMVVDAVNRFFDMNLPEYDIDLPPQKQYCVNRSQLPDLFLQTYAIERDSDMLKTHPDRFETFRRHYPVRREICFSVR